MNPVEYTETEKALIKQGATIIKDGVQSNVTWRGKMRIIASPPPDHLLQLIQSNGMSPTIDRTCFTYGNTIYNPGGLEIPEHLLRHEETHTAQQGEDPQVWWHRYVNDPYFRIDQEAEAFAIQYVFFRKYVNHDRNASARFLNQLAAMLASQTYGKVLGHTDAQRMIQRYASKVRV